jgi:hypothetical protein
MFVKYRHSEAPRPPRQDGAGTVGLPGKVISFYIVTLDPAYKAGLAGHVPVKNKEPVEKLIFFRLIKNAKMQGARNPEE